MNRNNTYDVVIIGAGVTGTAILYVLSKYTTVKNIALIEKYPLPAQVNSAHWNNSQTLHFGDIETNYSYDKAASVNEAAELVAGYVEKNRSKLFNKTHKMVLAVGDKEVKRLEERYDEIKSLYPNLKKISRSEIAKLEPKIVEERNSKESLLALYTEDGYAIDYGKLAESFVENGKGKNKEVFLDTKLRDIFKQKDSYIIQSNMENLEAKVVVVSAGAHSLIYAQKLGYGKELGLLPVAGSFYCSQKMLNGKVYTLQTKKLPFAAIHGDPDVANPEETRFGPIAKVLPILEKRNPKSFFQFLKLFRFRWSGIMSIINILKDPVYYRYVFWNMVYEIPWLGKYAFLREVRKIIPSIKGSELHYGWKIGGIRPQVVDTKKKKVALGEAKLVGDNIIFNITPSPGASVCLKNAEIDTQKVVDFLGKKFDREKFLNDLK